MDGPGSGRPAVIGVALVSHPPGGGIAAGWTLPGGNLQNTRDVASPVTSTNVSKLGVAWTVPIRPDISHLDYATAPVVVNGVVCTQDMKSDVLAIELATGEVLWTHTYNSRNGGPDGVNPAVGEYLGHAKATLWALNARTGTPEWSWDEVQNLWGKPGINSGGGQWCPPSFERQGNLYIGVANPGPIALAGWPPGYPWGTSRPGPDLYTDSVVKLSRHGRLLWHYQLTPHDLYDWDLQDPPLLASANGLSVVIDGGKAGILVELNAHTGQLIWKLPVGVHSGHDNDGRLTENARPSSHIPLPAGYCLEPGVFGGIESQLATNGSATFAAVNDLPVPISEKGLAESSAAFEAAIRRATGEMVAVNQGTGTIEWDDKLPSSPYGAATVTNNVVFTTTFRGDLYAFNTATGAILLDTRMPAGSNAPVTIDGDYVIAGAGVPQSGTQRPEIIAHKLGATGGRHE